MAREVLGFTSVRLVNLFALPSYRSGGLSELGATTGGWLKARDERLFSGTASPLVRKPSVGDV